MSLGKIINGLRKAACVGLTALVLAVGVREARAETYYVGPEGSIQTAINNAKDNDKIIVLPGTYTENINFLGKRIILKSTDPENPDTVTNTVIRGNGSGPVVTFNNGEDVNSVLKGVSITGGNSYYKGAGIYCLKSSPTISNCIVKDNISGDGSSIMCQESSASISDCTATQNTGAVAIHCRGNTRITNCKVSENISSGVYGYDGMIVNKCIINGNKGGGLSSGRNITANECVISDNGGVGISCYDNTLIQNSVIKGNKGGGVNIWGHSSKIINSIIINNKGIAAINCAYKRNVTIDNCTISNNSSQGVYCMGSTMNLNNCILFGNLKPEIYVGGNMYWTGTLSILYSNIPGGEKDVDIEQYGILTWGTGNIDVDPLFADPNNNDYHLKSQAGRWDANEGRWTKDDVTSLCIDAGDPHSPIGLEPFPNGGIINMGAYGGTIEASKSYFGEPICETIVAGDINGDCKVDFKDFALMAFHWLEER
jgi:hypothetical protein